MSFIEPLAFRSCCKVPSDHVGDQEHPGIFRYETSVIKSPMACSPLHRFPGPTRCQPGPHSLPGCQLSSRL